MHDKPSSPPVDIERFKEITDGDQEVLRQLSEEYLAQSEDIINAIQQAIEDRSMESARLLAHKLRGSSCTCGITILVEPLGKLEHLSDDSDFETATELHQEIKNGLEKTRAFLNHHLS